MKTKVSKLGGLLIKYQEINAAMAAAIAPVNAVKAEIEELLARIPQLKAHGNDSLHRLVEVLEGRQVEGRARQMLEDLRAKARPLVGKVSDLTPALLQATSALESETKSVLKEHLETLSAKQNQILAEIKRLMEPFCETVREAEDIANGCWAFRQLEFERASLKTMPFASQAKRLVQIYGAPARD